MTPSASPPSPRSERGAITWVTLVLLLSLVAGIYLALVWGPIYIVRYEAGVLVGQMSNVAVHDRADDQLVVRLCERLAALGTVKAPEGDGSIVEVPAVDVRPQDVTWERDATSIPRTLHVAFTYTTSVHYPLIDRFAEKTFTIDVVQDIQPVKW